MINPKWNKYLLPLVLLIWVGVLVRFGSSCQDEVTENQAAGFNFSLIPLDSVKTNQYELKLDYRDPFLDKAPAVKIPVSTANRSSNPALTTITPPAPKAVPPLPPLSYKGGVQNSSSGEITGVLFINKSPYTILEGDVVAGLEILKLNLHSLQLLYADSVYTINSQ